MNARATGRHVVRALAAAGGHPQPVAPRPAPPVRAFADAMAELVSAVCVVTAAGGQREPHGLVATSLCSYSADPPSVLVCLGRNGGARAAISSADAFGVHILREGQGDVARWFATSQGRKFDAVDWRWDGGVPALAGAYVVAYLRCLRSCVKRHGDHSIVIGEVDTVALEDGDPLVYRRRRFEPAV